MKFSSKNTSFLSSDLQGSSPRTDLACESLNTTDGAKGTEYREYSFKSIPVSELYVKTAEGERECGRRIGRYTTVHTGPISLLCEEGRTDLCDALSHLISSYTRALSGRPISPETTVLVAGLGNRFISPDSVGPRTADKINVTGHLRTGMQRELFRLFGCSRICAVHPGVMGQTGIEAAAMIRGACDHIRPDIVIAVDALCARSAKRLSSTVQLSDAGIEPGSGIGNRRGPINSSTLGAPVLAIGVPTVVDSTTLVTDTLEKAGITDFSPSLASVLRETSGFFVCPGDSDILSEEISTIIAKSINRAFCADGL